VTAPSRTLLGRRNPSVKLALLFVVSAALLFVWDPVTPALLYLTAVPAVLVTTRIGVRRLAVAHVPFAAFALGLLVVNLVSRPVDEGLLIGSSLALRTLLIGVLSTAFVATTDPVDLMTSLRQHAHLSPRVTYALLAGYRMLQEMPREWETIRQAQAVRGPLRTDGTLPRDTTSLARASFALLVHSLRKGERVAQTLESRGLGLAPRTTWRQVPLSRADAVLVVVVLAAFASALGTTSALGMRSSATTMWSG
jgi:energy-coupling factor transport system permease protein